MEGAFGDTRRIGLTTAEKKCMNRKYVHVPSLAQVGEDRVYGDPNHPTPQARRKKPVISPESLVCDRVDLYGESELERQTCQILEQLLPLPEGRTPQASAPNRRGALRQPHSVAPSGHHGSQLEAKVGGRTPLKKSAASGRAGPSFHLDAPAGQGTSSQSMPTLPVHNSPGAARARGTTAAAAAAAAAAAESIAAAAEQLPPLIKRPSDWDANSSNLRKNVVRLVQGASAQKVERESGGKIRFIHGPSHQQADSPYVNDDYDVPEPPEELTRGATHMVKKGPQEMMGHPLHVFRRKMAKRFTSLAEAFEGLNVDRNARLDMREWCDMLVRFGMCSLFEARVIFELMDSDRDGSLTLDEFNIGLETIAPVISLSALRKRLVCLGFSSVLQAVAHMNGPGEDTTLQPLTFLEFATALKRVWVIEDREHRILFNLVRDPVDPTGRTSLSDLAAGLAAVSPLMLLGEVRVSLEAKWGSLQAAYEALQDEWLESAEQFEEKGSEWMDITRAEAAKMFRFADIDHNGNLSRKEVMGSIRMAQSSVQMEDIRRRVQQSFRGIESALWYSIAQKDQSSLDDNLRFNAEELVDVLETVDLGRVEIKQLVKFMQATSEQGLTLSEFCRGLKMFAPSCCLEGLRLQLVRHHDRASDAFNHVKQRRVPLTQSELGELLRQAGADTTELDTIFDLVDIRNCGYVTLTEFLAALQGSQAGTRRWKGAQEREETAERTMRDQLAPLRGAVSEIKQDLKRIDNDLPDSQERSCIDRGDGQQPRDKKGGRKKRSRVAKSGLQITQDALKAVENQSPRGSSMSPKSETNRPSSSPGDFKEVERVGFARDTIRNIKTSLDALPPQYKTGHTDLRGKTINLLSPYFISNQHVLAKDGQMLAQSYSRAKFHNEVENLRRAEKPRALRRANAASAPSLAAPVARLAK